MGNQAQHGAFLPAKAWTASLVVCLCCEGWRWGSKPSHLRFELTISREANAETLLVWSNKKPRAARSMLKSCNWFRLKGVLLCRSLKSIFFVSSWFTQSVGKLPQTLSPLGSLWHFRMQDFIASQIISAYRLEANKRCQVVSFEGLTDLRSPILFCHDGSVKISSAGLTKTLNWMPFRLPGARRCTHLLRESIFFWGGGHWQCSSRCQSSFPLTSQPHKENRVLSAQFSNLLSFLDLPEQMRIDSWLLQTSRWLKNCQLFWLQLSMK